MAILRGEQGSVKFDDGGGTASTIAATRNWSLNITKDSIDTTKHGDTFRGTQGGLIKGTGSVELLYDPAQTGEYAAFIDDVLTVTDDGTAAFELFPDSSQSAKKFSFNGVITEAEYGANVGDLQVINCSFETNGTITSAI